MADLPNTENLAVIQHAVAWEIAKQSVQQKGIYQNASVEERTNILTNEYLRVYRALRENKDLD